MESNGEGRNLHIPFLSLPDQQMGISVSLPFSNAGHGMGAGKIKGKIVSRLNLAIVIGWTAQGLF